MKLICSVFLIFTSMLVRLSSQYMEFKIEDDDVCSLIKKRKIHLERDANSAMTIRSRNINDHPLDWNSNMKCRFQLNTRSGYDGIIAVIQTLSFRKNPATNECIDYVQFIRKNGSYSQRFCGRFNAEMHMDHNFIGPSKAISIGNSFVDYDGEMNVIIYIAKERLREDEEMDLKIVFTSYRHCSKVRSYDDFKPCSLERREFCIFNGFFGDKYINCPLPDCTDEMGCTHPVPPVISKNRSNRTEYNSDIIMLSILGTMVVVCAVFVVCSLTFRHFRIFCFNDSCTNSSRATQDDPPEPARVLEMTENVENLSTNTQESSGGNTIEQDKDLPPSYDSLFPAR